jgi:sulfite reductase (NADPH) hemoprotein beta-component
MPDLLARLEKLLTILGLDEQEIIVRMTGCPNGCARPYMAEIGLVGRAPNKYQLYLGGNESCTRLNRLYKENVLGTSLIDELRPLFERYTCERIGRERFGDFCARVLWPEAGAKN